MTTEPNVYLDTIARLEPEIAMIDAGAYYASAAISLKRIADSLEKIAAASADIPDRIQFAITEGANGAIYTWRQR